MKVFPIIKCVDIACNLRCDYCYYRYLDQSVKADSVMSPDVLESLTEQLFEVNPGLCNFLWHGGEPLLAGIDFFESALEFQDKYQRGSSKIINSVQTNGALLNEKWVDFFKAHHFCVGVSLDGPEHIHNRHRKKVGGSGSFNDVMRGIRYSQQVGLEIGAIIVVTSYSAQFPEEIYHFMLESGIKKFALNPAFEIDKSGHLCEFSVSDQDFSRFLEKMMTLWLKDDDPTVEIRQFSDPLRGLLGGELSACIYSGMCEQFLDIYPNGNVRPCHSRNGEADVVGNIISERLSNILKHDVYLKFKRHARNLPSECLNCRWFNVCHGGCTDHRDLTVDGQFQEKYAYCGSRKLVFSQLEKVIQATDASRMKADSLMA